MELLGAFVFSLILASLTQIPYTQAQVCRITSIKSPSASSLLVTWNRYIGATNYFLDLRVINATDIAPVVVTLPASSTQKVVQGLRPGAIYSVTLKVFQFWNVMCVDKQKAVTVPATSQITYSKAISSTAIQLEWARVYESERYFLIVNSTSITEYRNLSFTGLSGVVEDLQASTAYECYVVTSNVAGLGARSRIRTISTLVQPPNGVNAEQTGKRSARVTWQPVERVLQYKVTVRDLGDPSRTPFNTNVQATSLDVQNILPCSSYQISVASVNTFLEPGEATQYIYTTNTLSPVTSISVDYSCASGSSIVSWVPVSGADSYRAAAIDSNGTVLWCTSEGTQCQISGLGCGQRYLVHVTAASDSCESTANATTHFETVPCPPTGLGLFRECSSNVIIFSWDPSNQTAYYRARAVDSHGEVMDCVTSDTSCFFTNTVCGRRYQFTVHSVSEGQCNSADSLLIDVQTAPCQPRNLRTSAACLSDVLTSTWDRAEGALSYTVEALGNKGERNYYNCSSYTNSCAMPGVHCGESLTILITAYDDECPSERALGEVAETVPCTPQNVSAVMDCSSDSITLSWEYSHGALFYIATATDEQGATHTCTAMRTDCQIAGLRCGATYSAFIIATNLKCNSTHNQTVNVETAPCPPDHIEAFLDCAANHALIVWQGHQSRSSYTASMEDQHGGLLSCSTTANHCQIPSLKCGQLYDVSITHHDGVCPSMPSRPIRMESVPCGPANVQTQVDCGSGVLTVGWNVSVRAESYTTIVSTGNGRRTYCNSTETQCSVDTLECGESYIVEVMSVNGTCLSMPSQAMIVREVPCVPTNVTAERSCVGSLVEVTWQASRGARNYTAVAVGTDGRQHECSSNGTACSVADMRCSQAYTISVTAVDDACSSLESESVMLQTVPCPPAHVSGSMDCSANTASLAWSASANAAAYAGSAVGTDGHSVSCGASAPGCQLAGLHCGQEYAFTVSATDGSCESPESEEFRQETAPCAPQSVESSLSCSTNTLTVSWTLGATPLHYNATARAGGGTAASCTTQTSTCNITGLECGTQYTVIVTAANGNCTGPESVPQTIQTVPCMPAAVRADVECATNTLRASWAASAGALSYTSVVSGPGGFSQSCSTSDPSCSFSSLECAKSYTLSVVSIDNQCNSTASADVSVATVPCDPENVTARLQCGSGLVTASWHASAGASGYTVLAQAAGGQRATSCRTASTSCDLGRLECGEAFNVSVLADDGTCNSTALAATTVETAPCAPAMEKPALDCASNRAAVSWAEDPDAQGVVVNATAALGHVTGCSSAGMSCQLADLLCGQTYTARGTARGGQCDSDPSDPFNIITAPCTPASVMAEYTCGTSIALLRWDESLGRESFFVRVEGPDHSDFCSTAETHCSVTSLLCGRVYNVSVEAVAGHCNSSQAATAQLHTAPCAPQNVSASLVCANNTASVTWVGSPGSVAYNVTALGRHSDAKYCRTADTSCDLANMNCAETYDITVMPFSETCKGFYSTAYTFTAGPCPPTDVQVSLECEGNVGSVSWVAADKAEMYVATATGNNGQTCTCSTNGTGCSFTGLHCGETYAVTVVTVERGCQSEPGPAVNLRAALCPPSGLTGQTACGSNDLTITWDPSPEAGVTYVLHSQGEGGADNTSSTTATAHVLTGLRCGMHFTFQASARDSVCTSNLSHTLETDTAPCPPTNLTAWADCGTNKGTITWAQSAGAATYTAEAVGTHGHHASCMSNGTSCSVKLDCGHRYTATVVSSTGACNSSVGANIQFDSAPCLPGNVLAQLDCNGSSLAVSWQESVGNPESYTALAICSDGTRASCHATTTACVIQSLRCGHTYSIAVTTANVNCGVIEGSDYQIQTAPCKPESPTVELECSTHVAVVAWNNSGTDQRHTVSAVDAGGLRTTCNSTEPTCTFTQLTCGEAYTLSVVGLTDQCTSEASTTMNLNTAPCVPTLVTATVDCQTDITAVTWDPARGANGYTVYAEGNRGHNATCINTDTNCAFSNLICGQDYTIVVIAEHDSCVSLASDPVTASTGPCPHSNLEASLDCSSNSALISWTAGNGTLTYNASAEAFDPALTHHVTCSTPSSACNITGLLCGERYRVSVRGEGHTCPSPAPEWVFLNPAPCPPTQVSVQSSCDSDTASVSWATSQGSFSYMAVAEGDEGHRASCNSSGTACDIAGLLCGQTYEVYVVGMDEDCVGAKSDTHALRTAPCVPQDVQTHLECQSGVLNVTWQQSGDADHFHATVQSSEGHVSVCDTDGEPTCVVPNMQCGLTYTVVVVAHDEVCNSSHSPVQNVTAAPCPPSSVSAVVDCDSSMVSVSWDSSWDFSVLYTATAADASGQSHACNATATGCDLTSLACGTEYNVSVTPSRDGCVGVHTPCQTVRTAPCVPVLSEVEMDCLSDSAWVVWEESAGAELYTAVATDSDGRVVRCNSSESECAVDALQCGRHYNFSLTASDSQCSSAPSNTVQSETAPCPPQDVLVSVGCENRTVSVSWTHSPGALSYAATLERTDGETSCCSTNGTACDVPQLPCGEMYVVTVNAEGRVCNSSQSMPAIVRTAPCVPRGLQTSLSCSSNVASMSWASSKGGQLYSVEAVSAGGHSTSCTSHLASCDLTTLNCGELYTTTVLARDSTCNSTGSEPADIKTVPCTPASVSAEVDCQRNDLSVSWAESAGADSYTATLVGSDGRATNCQALGADSCNVTCLACGKIYHVSVVASDGYCDSQPSAITDTHSVPCAPRNIDALMDCELETAVVSWSPGEGATSYAATVESALGHEVVCVTNDTNCELGVLACGQQYSVSVQALGEACGSSAQMPGLLVTQPCVPLHVTVNYALSIGQLTWDQSQGATAYTAEALTDQGLLQSCRTNDTYCALYLMACGQTFNVTVTAHNDACRDIAISAPFILETEPCPPNNVETHLECEGGAGTVSWEASAGAVLYEAILDGRSGHSLSCLATNTSCSVAGLQCGTVYYARVRALGEQLNGSDSTTVLLTSAPCAPDVGSLEVEVDCRNNTALVSWAWSDGAESYQLTALASDGHRATCVSEENYCNMRDLACGQTYMLSLTAINENCQIQRDTGVTFQTRPWVPQRVAVDLQCGTHTAMLSWEQRDGVEFYMACATISTGGPIENCNSTGSTCQFQGLDCGVIYSFTVTAHGSQCQSEPSREVEIRTEPCQPSHVTADGSCDNNTVVLAWADTMGASGYTVVATGDLGYITAFRTNDSALEAELPCGQTYSFTVVGQDERCDSPASTPAEFRTAPCVPRHVESFTQCEDSLGSVSWAMSEGAESYTAVAMAQDGNTHMCSTNGTTCTWDDLHCGDLYIIHVIADDYLCSSVPSNSTSIRMAPCIPQNLVSRLDCDLMAGSLTWDASAAAEVYIVTAETDSGHRVEQTTNDTSALFSELRCGQEYYLTVRAVGPECRSAPSTPARQQTEPCAPTSVSSSVDCVSNIAFVTWLAADGAEYYTATMEGPGGESGTCMSSTTQCGVANLLCGETYTVSVTASNRQCNSTPGVEVSLNTVPCVPEGVAVAMDCADNVAQVQWGASQGALSYQVAAQSSRGLASSCQSADPDCTLGNLTCGAPYTVQVVAMGDGCRSLPSPAVEFQTAPCTPEISGATLDCFTDSILLEWLYAEGSLSYTAVAQATNGHASSCSTANTNCELAELACGQLYTVTVVASDGHCNGTESASLEVASVPCAPQSVVPTLDCSNNSARVTWDASSGAESYEVHAIGTEGHVTGCDTADTACVVPDLRCGYTYNISVVAVSNGCNVSESEITQLRAVPCVPDQLDVNVDCESGIVAVSWEHSNGATTYTAVAEGNGGYASSCNSSSTVCQFSDLLCGLSYSVTITASDGVCSSAHGSSIHLDTVPCEPQNVSAEIQCSSNAGLVSWEQDEGASLHSVRAVGPDGHRAQCNSTATGCRLPGLHCGQRYNLTVNTQDGRCDSSNTFLSLQSGPCEPTNVHASLQCRSNSAAVQWERASGAVEYEAVGSTDGHCVACNASLTHCDLEQLQCGQTYNVSVFSLDDSCISEESTRIDVRTAPCPPQDVDVQVDCIAASMTVMWAANLDADSFQVEAVTSAGAVLSCDSIATECSISNLTCGHSYSVTVVAVRGSCESAASTAVQVSSAPCVPHRATGSLDCVTNSAWLVWEVSEGAESYTVFGDGEGRYNSTCTSSSPNCEVPDLRCGVIYDFHVIAVNTHCESGPSNTFQIKTAACSLTTVTMETECHSNTIRVGWELNEGSRLYVAIAEGHDRSILNCNSTANSCDLIGVSCGMQYTVIVSASSDKCRGLRSPPHKINTAPCAPEALAVQPVCESEGVVVTWAQSPVAQSYMLMATGRDGDVHTCDTAANNCTLPGLRCGQPYTCTVTASADNCTSPGSADVSFSTVPCDPEHLSADVQCESNSAVLSWDASEGSVQYYASAQTEDGEALCCETMATSCTIEGLECGPVYNFSVQASDGICNSSFSEPLLEGAVPCAPASVQERTHSMGRATLIMASWSAVDCLDVQYLLEVTGRIQDDPHALMEVSSYWLDHTFFEMLLPCSTSYNLTVRTRNSVGVSEPSEPIAGITAPCPPLDVTYSGNTTLGLLSWQASVFAAEYTVYQATSDGRAEVCNTTELTCLLVGVESSDIEMTASNSVGESIPTNISEVLSVPEVQVTVTGVLLHVKWAPVNGANHYTLIVREDKPSRPHREIRTVYDTVSTVTDLKPATRYCVDLSAVKNSMTQSAYSQPVCVTTGVVV